jgi:hypothetical protein
MFSTFYFVLVSFPDSISLLPSTDLRQKSSYLGDGVDRKEGGGGKGRRNDPNVVCPYE